MRETYPSCADCGSEPGAYGVWRGHHANGRRLIESLCFGCRQAAIDRTEPGWVTMTVDPARSGHGYEWVTDAPGPSVEATQEE